MPVRKVLQVLQSSARGTGFTDHGKRFFAMAKRGRAVALLAERVGRKNVLLFPHRSSERLARLGSNQLRSRLLCQHCAIGKMAAPDAILLGGRAQALR